MRTTVLGIRLNDYQREKLEAISKENDLLPVETVRVLVDKLIEGKIQLRNAYYIDNCDLTGLKRIAKERGITTQALVDMIVEQIDGAS